MFRKLLLICTLSSLSMAVFAVEGMINVKSNYSVQQTADNLEKVLSAKGMRIFQRINHAAAAKTVGIELSPTQLIIFGNPKAGSPLMKCKNSVALDLPQKALVWKDDQQIVWISYNDPAYLKQRHNIAGCDAALDKVSAALTKLTAKAAQ